MWANKQIQLSQQEVKTSCDDELHSDPLEPQSSGCISKSIFAFGSLRRHWAILLLLPCTQAQVQSLLASDILSSEEDEVGLLDNQLIDAHQ